MTGPRWNGGVRWLLFLASAIAACVCVSWVLLNNHAERPHAGAATSDQHLLLRQEVREDQAAMQVTLEKILERLPPR